MLTKIHPREILVLGIIALAMIFGCGEQMPANVDKDFLNAIAKTRQQLDRPFLATFTEDDFLGVKRSYYRLTWSFPMENEQRQKVQFRTFDDVRWQSIYPGNVDWKRLKSFDTIANFPVVIFNRWYTALATESPRFITEIYENDSSQVENDNFLEGLYLMKPYDWSMEKFLRSEEVSNIDWTADKKDVDLAILSCDVDFSEDQSPLHEALKGKWSAKFSRSKKMLIEQSIESPLISCKYTYRFDNPDSELPSATTFDATNRDPADSFTAALSTKFLKVELNHRLPDEVCFLSYFDLPEPPGFRPKSLWTARNIMFGILGVIIVGFVGSHVRQYYRRTK